MSKKTTAVWVHNKKMKSDTKKALQELVSVVSKRQVIKDAEEKLDIFNQAIDALKVPNHIQLNDADVDALLHFVAHQFVGHSNEMKTRMQGLIAYAQAFKAARFFGVDELNSNGPRGVARRLLDYRPELDIDGTFEFNSRPVVYYVYDGVLRYFTQEQIASLRNDPQIPTEVSKDDSESRTSSKNTVGRDIVKKPLCSKARGSKKKSCK